MAITVTFDPPLPSDSPSVFNTKAFTLLGDLNDWSTEANSLASTVSSNASTSTTNASNASTSADAAATSASNAAASYDSFDDRYLGSKSSAPTLDNDGAALLTGALYWDSVLSAMFVRTSGGAWTALNASTGIAQAITVNSSSAALTVTQTGAGNTFVVEDSTSTDTTPFVIDAAGLVGVGGASPADHLFVYGAGHTVAAITDAGNRLANVFIAASGSAAGDGGSVSLGTLVANGVKQQWALKTLLTDGSANGKSDLVFSGRASTADTKLTERMRIDSAGGVGIGNTAGVGTTLALSRLMTGATTGYGLLNLGEIQSDVTSQGIYNRSFISTQAAAFTCSNVYGFQASQGTIGAGSTVTNQFGFAAASTLTGATNNYGFYSDIASAANRYNFYAAGTAANYFGGNVTVGGGGTLGYGAGSGGTVTQATSKSTSVTLNKPSGQITMHNAALASGANVSFAVNNTAVTGNDTVFVHRSSGGTGDAYEFIVTAVYAGGFSVRVKNDSAGSLSEAVSVNFSVIKGSTS